MPKKTKAIISEEAIASKIIWVRGERIMLDRDLAEMYAVETRVLNQAVSRNIMRFPEDFMFELTRDEILRISQTVTSYRLKFSKRVRVFTEQGVAMLSSVLKSEQAIEVNIEIMRAFTKMRQMIFDNAELRKEIENLRADVDGKFQVVFETLDQLFTVDAKAKKIGFLKEQQAKYMNKR